MGDPHLDAALFLDRTVSHFAGRRDAIDVIGRFGNRFEDWFKWETALAIHRAAFLDTGAGIGCVLLERDDCDLFVGRNEWPKAGLPEHTAQDLWVEMKVRCNSDKGPAELAAAIADDVKRQSERKLRIGMGTFLSIAAVVCHPNGADVEKWVGALSSAPARARGPAVRRLHADWRGSDSAVLMALLSWEV